MAVRVFETDDATSRVPKVAAALNAKGIKFEVRTPIACACAGGTPPGAEVWILDDAQLEAARAAIAGAKQG